MADTPVNWSNFVEHAALSDVGLRRSNNQDSYSVVPAGDERDWLDRGHLFMVADGMGAHAAGELASKLAVNGVPHTYHKLLDRPAPAALRQAIIETNAQIHGRGEANAEFHGMGTTCSVLALLPQGAMVGHVGDSRVYRLRNRRLDQLTFDHSLVWEMTASGQMPAGEAASFIPKNIITRSLGPHAEVKVDLEGPFPLELGDTFLLCSDGLSGQVTDAQIAAIIGTMSPAEAVQALIDLANLNGGPDNITVVVARVAKPLEIAPQDRVFHQPSSRRREGFSMHPVAWVLIGVALLIAGGLAVTGRPILAAGGLIVAVLAALGGWLHSMGGDTAGAATDEGNGPFGTGPHTALDGTPNAEIVRELEAILQKLREAAREQRWSIDMQRLNALTDAAKNAEAAGNFGVAVRQTALAISFMMSQIRQQRVKTPARDNSSVIDL